MPIQVTWTAIPNGIEDGKLKVVAMATIKLTSGSTAETTLGASFPAMLNWHKNVFTFTLTFAGAMGVKTFNIPNVTINQQAWPATFKASTPVKPYKWDGPPIKKWESYSVTRILDQTKTSYAAIAQMSLGPKYPALPGLIQNQFKNPDIFRSPFFEDRLPTTIPDIRPGRISPPGGVVRPPLDDEEFGHDLIVATDYGTGLYGSAREMLATAYRSACDEWRNNGGEVPEDAALWWEAREFFEAYDEHEEDQGGVQARPTVQPQIRPGLAAVQSKYKDRYAGKPTIVGPPKLDFHEALGILGEHPQLMRQFGLIFDLEVPVATANLAPTGSVTLAVASTGGGTGAASDNPLTIFQYNAAQKVFLPAHKSPVEYKTGFYNLGPDFVQLTGVDVDGLTIKMLDFAALLRNKFALQARTSMIHEMASPGGITAAPARPGTTRPPATTRPPTGGTGTGAAGRTAAAANPALNQGIRANPAQLNQQMLMSDALLQKMGDRPDTAAPPGMRSAGVAIARKDRFQMVSLMMAAANTNIGKLAAPKSVTLYFEDMLRGYRMDVFSKGKWHSLVTRQGGYVLPGSVPVPNVDEESWVSTAASKDPNAPATDTAKIHEVMVRWTGYSCVNQKPGKTLDQENNVVEGNTQVDPRFPITMQFKPRPGTLPELRFGQKYRFRLRLATVAGTGPELDATSPGSPYETPELTYRRWEAVMSPALYEHAQSREGESANHIVIRKFLAAPTQIDPAIRQMVPPSGDGSLAELHGKFDLNGKPDPATYAKILERENMQPLQKYVGGKVTRLPYFADPMAEGIAVRGAPHTNANLSLKFPGTWPEQQSLQLEVRPGTIASTAAGDKFTLFLQPGEIAFPKVSSTVPAGGANLFGILEWVPPASVAALTAAIPSGQMWTVTPFRELVALYATQIPEEKATVDRPSATRAEASTKCAIRGRVRTHSWTTASVDFNAAYSDDVDLLEEPKRTTLKQDKSGNGFKLKIVRAPNAPVVFQPFSEDQEFGDSKHHEVKFELVAHSPFKQYFPPNWPLPANPEGTRFTETTPSAFTVHVPASKRPAPPLIEYVVPTFGWNVNKAATSVSSSRSGNGLRVYLRRPWFSSGNDEKLAVCILSGAGANLQNVINDNTTKLGADPVFKHGDVPAVTAGIFVGESTDIKGPSAVVTTTPGGRPAIGGAIAANPGAAAQIRVPAADMPGVTATVVPYDVHFDEEKQMWYADIIVNAGLAYTPFIRLALARYQPYALTGLNLSAIQKADIMQLQNNRSASVVFIDASNKIRASVTGPIGETSYGQNIAIGTIEEKVGPDDDTGWRVVTVGGKELSREIPIKPPSLIPVAIPANRPPTRIVRPPEGEEELLAEESEELTDQTRTGQTRPPVVRPGTNPQIRPGLAQPIAQEGEITLPKPRGSTNYRLVIREYERFFSDTGEPELPDVPGIPVAPQGREPGSRLVYMDVIPLR